MIKPTFCLHRLPSLSRDEFQRYWRRAARPAGRELRGDAAHPALRPDAPARGRRSGERRPARVARGTEDYDGVAELWWDSLDDLAAATASDEGRAASLALLEDERRFIDLARSPLWLGREHAVIGQRLPQLSQDTTFDSGSRFAGLKSSPV
ncbi:MAG: EthD domain-containing protein [Burkholderiaceae bacterium]